MNEAASDLRGNHLKIADDRRDFYSIAGLLWVLQDPSQPRQMNSFCDLVKR